MDDIISSFGRPLTIISVFNIVFFTLNILGCPITVTLHASYVFNFFFLNFLEFSLSSFSFCSCFLVVFSDETSYDVMFAHRILSLSRFSPFFLLSFCYYHTTDIRPDLASALPHLRTWTLSGEALPIELVRTFFDAAPEGSRMLNLYGSTEIAADVTCMEITEKDVIEGRLDRMGPIVPIGYPISNTVSSFCFSIFWLLNLESSFIHSFMNLES